MITCVTDENQAEALIFNDTQKNIDDTIFDFLYQNDLPDGVEIGLTEVSKEDEKWDYHRSDTQSVQEIFSYNPDFERWSERMSECSTFLMFKKDGEKFKLNQSYFCHIRHCPVCQWRKSLFWKAMLYRTLDALIPAYPTHRFVFLTLTVKNCEVNELRDTLKMMNKAWARLIERKEFVNVVDGWVRTTEITRDKTNPNTHAHPHFHAILMVKSSYFTHNYIKQGRWVELWQESLRVDYIPVVDIRAVKAKKSAIENGDYMGAVQDAISEVMKYSVKPADMKGDGSYFSQRWFYIFCEQVKKLRFVASGGILKKALKNIDEITDEQMIHTDENSEQDNQEIDKRQIVFSYFPSQRRYIFNGRY